MTKRFMPMDKNKRCNLNFAPPVVTTGVVAANNEGRGFEMNEKNRRRS